MFSRQIDFIWLTNCPFARNVLSYTYAILATKNIKILILLASKKDK